MNRDLSKYNSIETFQNFINENNIKRDTVISVAEAFPSKAMKNLALSGVLYEIR